MIYEYHFRATYCKEKHQIIVSINLYKPEKETITRKRITLFSFPLSTVMHHSTNIIKNNANLLNLIYLFNVFITISGLKLC